MKPTMKHLPLPVVTGVHRVGRNGKVRPEPSIFHFQSGDFQILVWNNGSVVIDALGPRWVMADKPIYQGKEAVKFAHEMAKKVGRFGDPLREELLRNMVWRYSC